MSKHIDVTRELANAQPYGHYTMTLRDANGNIIKQGRYEVHSLIWQHWAVLRNTMASNGFNAYTRIGGSGTSNLEHMLIRGAGTGSPSDARGIVVGTSSTPVTLANVGLGGFIESGNSAGQLSYAATVIGYDDATGRITLSQTFTNDTAGDIDVNEVGIAVEDTSAEFDLVLLVRDVPGSTFTLLPMAVLTVSYELTWPFGCQNFAMLFARHQIARNTTNLSLYNATGTLVSASTYGAGTGAFGFVGEVGDTTRGIAVGDGNAGEAFNTFALDSQIAHGTNAGELFHYASTVSSFSWDNSDNLAVFYLSRAFRNKSGANVNIAEIGLVSNATIGATNFTYLFDRRVLSANVELADGDDVTITWAFKYNFT